MIPALSLRQPWLWAVTDLGKPIENRKWKTSHRGPFWLHAAKGCTVVECGEALRWMRHNVVNPIATQEKLWPGLNEPWPGLENLPRGGLCGRSEVVGVIEPIHMWSSARKSGQATLDEVRDGMAARGVSLTLEDLRWWMPDQYGFVLRNTVSFPLIPCIGALSFFRLSKEKEMAAECALPARIEGTQ